MRKNRFLYSTIFSIGIHGLLIFGTASVLRPKSSSTHFSVNQAPAIQIRRLVKVKKVTESPKKLTQKKARSKQLVQKKATKLVEQSQENAPVIKKVIDTGVASEKAKYLKSIRDQILAQKRYPRVAKMLKKQGVVDIYFEVSYPSHLSNIQIKKGSGHAILDRSALETIEALGKLPRMPDFLKSEVLKVAIPIKYELL
ncbi:TonB protein, C-terminal domain protein [Bacteriovorax sp. BAL6_X]|uniref:energy transducer TonB n=1 Tax=Bacteriovorax sp. BAL6_X TaxID=1201290 RepID=UPI00038632FB|nr:TonB family protein [Bacteriovorax sp. BAL6_X]EPZ49641.1 TonB protein, C-terminal domain protein [Bacteriovorax sp. BAL6_X]